MNPKTIAKWRKRTSVADRKTGPAPKSAVLSLQQEAVVVAFRRHIMLPLDDCLYALEATISELTRSSLHRCLERNGTARHLPASDVDDDRTRRMNRTIKEAAVKRFYYETHQHFRQYLTDSVNAYNFARRLKILKELHPSNTSAST